MLDTHYTSKLMGLQDVVIKKVDQNGKKLEISLEMERKPHICPVCGMETDRVHDYRIQHIRDTNCFGKDVTLHLRKRRYVCSCGKRFYEENTWLARYQRETQRTTMAILEKCRTEQSYTSIAREFDLSMQTVQRRFERIHYTNKPELPKVIGIDEFRGNSGGEKFQCILTDIGERKISNILPTRYQADLIDYFKKYSKTERDQVEYFVSDMYKTYEEIAKTYFPKATYVIDKYHWIRQAIWAMEAVRKEVQQNLPQEERKYFKKSRTLLLKHAEKLNEEQQQQVNIMLYKSVPLSSAYFMKERLYRVLEQAKQPEPDMDSIHKAFKEWIDDALESEIPAFVRCAKTYLNWYRPILNSFGCPYTNGFTEGCNNKIKVIKRNAYGVHTFTRFRNRVLYSFS